MSKNTIKENFKQDIHYIEGIIDTIGQNDHLRHIIEDEYLFEAIDFIRIQDVLDWSLVLNARL